MELFTYVGGSPLEDFDPTRGIHVIPDKQCLHEDINCCLQSKRALSVCYGIMSTGNDSMQPILLRNAKHFRALTEYLLRTSDGDLAKVPIVVVRRPCYRHVDYYDLSGLLMERAICFKSFEFIDLTLGTNIQVGAGFKVIGSVGIPLSADCCSVYRVCLENGIATTVEFFPDDEGNLVISKINKVRSIRISSEGREGMLKCFYFNRLTTIMARIAETHRFLSIDCAMIFDDEDLTSSHFRNQANTVTTAMASSSAVNINTIPPLPPHSHSHPYPNPQPQPQQQHNTPILPKPHHQQKEKTFSSSNSAINISTSSRKNVSPPVPSFSTTTTTPKDKENKEREPIISDNASVTLTTITSMSQNNHPPPMPTVPVQREEQQHHHNYHNYGNASTRSNISRDYESALETSTSTSSENTRKSRGSFIEIFKGKRNKNKQVHEQEYVHPIDNGSLEEVQRPNDMDAYMMCLNTKRRWQQLELGVSFFEHQPTEGLNVVVVDQLATLTLRLNSVLHDDFNLFQHHGSIDKLQIIMYTRIDAVEYSDSAVASSVARFFGSIS